MIKLTRDESRLVLNDLQSLGVPLASLELVQYSSLEDESASEIRIIELKPGRIEDDVRRVLHHVSLDDNIEYLALSYTWGPTLNPEIIVCNGLRLSITSNLYSALKKCRDDGQSVRFWIDANCIDQKNIPEREAQVAKMSRI